LSTEINKLATKAISLLQQLIATPSFSREEHLTADLLEKFLAEEGIQPNRAGHNVWAKGKHFDPTLPCLLLNSHHDTVKPNKGYTLDPFIPIEKEGKLFGLGSNDAGGPLVSLVAAFLYFSDIKPQHYNIILAATAEEEISGSNGIEMLLPLMPAMNCGIVGEPTLLQMAVAERGLLVLDCTAQGKAGHAARNEGENALYKAIKDIDWFRSFRFEKNSELLGPVKMTVTSIETDNKAHNVVPSECHFVVDIRINELYTHEEVMDTVRSHVSSQVQPRGSRLRSTMIPMDHPLVIAGKDLGLSYYGSPTASDKALMPFPALKLGPGDSARSHTADEYIFTEEIRKGIETYIEILKKVVL